ncbi:hypothetical protein [Methanocella conradii]|uniref:hypothetical protein n=1 Tax=Methanocella conradii TaxID=1175444 RepID=UPI00157D901A|nr:hypothetical protein [Methanocella conradii]
MLAQILQLALRIVGIVERILALIGVIQDDQRILAREHIPYQIESTVVATSLNVANPTYGLQAIETMLADVQAKVDAIYADYQQRNQPVTLPPTPPPGYGVDLASVPLSYEQSSFNAGQPTNLKDGLVMMTLHDWDRAISGIWPMADSPIFGVTYNYPINNLSFANYGAPVEDLSSVQPTDTVKSWLERVTGLTWHDYPLYNVGTTTSYVWTNEYAAGVVIVCTLTTEQLHQLAGIATTAVATAPVWPGLANVTLGTAVTFGPNDLGVTVPGPMDGVLIAITAYPAYKGTFNFAGDVSVRNIGAITFTSDHGQDEFPQLLGFQQAVYCPKSMTRAQSAKLRIVQGTSGTITPWTRTP